MRVGFITSNRADLWQQYPLIQLSTQQLDAVVLGLDYGDRQWRQKLASLKAPWTRTPMVGADPTTKAKILDLTSQWLKKNRPDWLVLFGDREEIAICAFAATALCQPCVHYAAGAITLGSLDNRYRQMISAAADLYFTESQAQATHLKKIKSHQQVHQVGCLLLDSLTSLSSWEQLRENLNQRGFPCKQPPVLVALHPETGRHTCQADRLAMETIAALKQQPLSPIIWTAPNGDAGSEAIVSRAKEFCQAADRIYIDTLGDDYLSCLQHAPVAIGNSSSFIVESGLLRTPTVNLGDRQRGREQGNNVVNCPVDQNAIAQAITTALSIPTDRIASPYACPVVGGSPATLIIQTLLAISPDQAQKIIWNASFLNSDD